MLPSFNVEKPSRRPTLGEVDVEEPISTRRLKPKNTLPFDLNRLDAKGGVETSSDMSASKTSIHSSQIPPPPDWQTCIHPGGWKYFYNPELRLVSDFGMDSQVGQDEFKRVQQTDAGASALLPNGWEKWIDTGTNGVEHLYINHMRRRATTVHPADADPEQSISGIRTRTDEEWSLALQQEGTYWEYMAGHPCHHPLPDGVVDEATGQLYFFATDRILNPEDSVVPFSKETSRDLLDILNSMVGNSVFNGNNKNSHIKTQFVSRLMEHIIDERLRQQYGRYKARDYLKQGRRPRQISEATLSWPIELVFTFLMTVICFGAPYSYQRRINEFFTTALGRTDTITEKWRQFVDENVEDWTDTNLVATVLISGAVALLAIPGIDTVTRVFGFLSVLASLASLITGLLNSWQHQHESHMGMQLTLILDFFSQAQTPLHTYKLLAIILSFPMALLIWAAIAFAAAIVVLAWRGIDVTFVQNTGDVTTFEQAHGLFQFGQTTGWTVSGTLLLLTGLVLTSFLFFLRVWSPYKKHKKRSLRNLRPLR